MEKQFLIETAQKQTLNQKRYDTEELINRVRLLKGSDKLIMKMYLQQGCTLKQLSSLAGVSQSTISRRINKVSDRLLSGKINAFFQNSHRFKPTEKKILKDYLREGMSQRQISRKRNLTRYRVRKAIRKLNAL